VPPSPTALGLNGNDERLAGEDEVGVGDAVGLGVAPRQIT
jgi:hypothetical protein